MHNHTINCNNGFVVQIIITVQQRLKGHQYWWLPSGYDPEIGHFQKWLAWWLPGG